MRRLYFALAILTTTCLLAGAADQAKPVYTQTFDDAGALQQFVFTDPAAWQLGRDGDNQYLELTKQSEYKPPHRSPVNIALLAGMQVDSFILEADLLQTGRDYGHRDMCVFFGFTDPAHFYYAHIATKTDPHAHNIFIVNDAPRTKISTFNTDGFDWGQNQWQKLRLTRDIKTGEVAVYMNDMSKPIMTAKDKTFTRGWIGFGSFDDTGRIDNIRLYAPQVTDAIPSFFQAAK